MSEPSPNAYIPVEANLSDSMSAYIAALTKQGTQRLFLRPSAGRVFHDLMLNWPLVDNWENETQLLCKKIAEGVYPLAGVLFAQAVEIAVIISPDPIKAPTHIQAPSTYLVFDTQNELERTCFLSPLHPLPQSILLGTAKGIVAWCRPVNQNYQTLADDHEQTQDTQTENHRLLERQNTARAASTHAPFKKTRLDRVKKRIYSAEQTRTDDGLPRSLAFTLRRASGILYPNSTQSARAFGNTLLSRATDPALRGRLRTNAGGLTLTL